MRGIFNELNISEEAISFQKDRAVVTEMTNIFERLIGYISKNADSITIHDVNDQPEIKEMEDLIKRRFGLSVSFGSIGDGGAFTMPTILTTNHALLNRKLNNRANVTTNRMVRELQKTKFTVDLEKAYISGEVTNYVVPIASELFWSKLFLGNFGLTPEEFTAVMLHEIGHVFTFLEYSNRLQVGNQVILEAIDEMNDPNKDPYKYNFANLEEYLDLENNEIVDSLSGKKDPLVMTVRLSTRFVDKLTQATKDDHYHKTSAEQLADNFVVKFGLGKELVFGLDKLHGIMGSPEKSPPMWFVVIFMQILSFINAIKELIYLLTHLEYEYVRKSLLSQILIIAFYFLFPGYAAILFAVLNSSRSLALLFITIYNSGDAQDDFSYDTLRDRTIRVLQAAIAELKNSNLTTDQLHVCLESIEEIKKLLKADLSNPLFGNQLVSPNIMKLISNTIFSNNRRAHKEKVLQQVLENALSNELFVSAAKLKVLSANQ